MEKKLRFNIDKHGYNIAQVDNYINNLTLKYEEKLAEQKDRLISLKSELDMVNTSLEEYKNKDRQISKALIMAVEKAEQIEESSNKIFALELKRIRILYHKWEEILEQIESEFPSLYSAEDTRKLIDEFRQNIEDVLTQNKNQATVRENIKTTLGNTYIKNILNRMDYVEENPVFEQKYKIAPTLQSNLNKFQNKVQNYNKIVNEQMSQNANRTFDEVDINSLVEEHRKENNRLTKFSIPAINKKLGENIIDKFLEEDDNNPYAKIITSKKNKKKDEVFNFAYPEPNDSGYDYREALNPSEDLDEIMKTFDFYADEKKE